MMGPSALAYERNPVRSIDMIEQAVRRFRATGDVLLPEQRKMYEVVAKRVGPALVLDVGCGCGWGSAVLRSEGATVEVVDIVDDNVNFAIKAHYLFGEVMDIERQKPLFSYDFIVCIEVIEHIANAEQAIKNMQQSAKQAIFFSSPNRQAPEIQNFRPANPYHVCEYRPCEIREKFPELEVLHPFTLEPLEDETQVTPLMYRLPGLAG